MFKILCQYLQVVMGANHADAEDCAQHAILMVIERIKQNAIREPGSLYFYVIRSAKNRYLRVQFENRRSNFQEDMTHYVPPNEQIDHLVTREEELALGFCLKKLKSDYRSFIDYFFQFPGAHASDVADHFGITVNNVWVRKHRIIKKLSECVEKKTSQ